MSTTRDTSPTASMLPTDPPVEHPEHRLLPSCRTDRQCRPQQNCFVAALCFCFLQTSPAYNITYRRPLPFCSKVVFALCEDGLLPVAGRPHGRIVPILEKCWESVEVTSTHVPYLSCEMYVPVNLSRIASSPAAKQACICAIKMHSTFQFQDESRESPSIQWVSVDVVLFLESSVHFYNYMLNTFHA
jgi:hypothetical protein